MSVKNITDPYLYTKNLKWTGYDVPVITETCFDGTIHFAMPVNTPPDTIAFNKNVVFQMERKSKMVARLRAKLDKKN